MDSEQQRAATVGRLFAKARIPALRSIIMCECGWKQEMTHPVGTRVAQSHFEAKSPEGPLTAHKIYRFDVN